MFHHRFILICLLVSLLSSFTTSEIHRTRTSKGAKAYPGSGLDGRAEALGDGEKAVSGSLHDPTEGEIEGFKIYSSEDNYSRDEAWIYAILATFLVGLTGIFPLVLPIDVSPSSNDERGINNQKINTNSESELAC